MDCAAKCTATRAAEHAVSQDRHGPFSPRVNASRPDEIDMALPVAEYAVPADGVQRLAKSVNAMPMTIPVRLPSKAVKLFLLA